MEIDVKDLGNFVGSDVWICHYKRPDITKKAIRNIPPTLVTVAPASDLIEDVYYCDYAFIKNAKKKGKPKLIQPYDNTGFRSRTGCPVHVFDDYQECVESWSRQLSEVQSKILIAEKSCVSKWREMYGVIEQMKI